MGSEVDTRLEELECRLALQEESIETMSDQIYQQLQQLGKLEQDISMIKDWIKGTLDNQQATTADGKEEPPPPHY